MQCSAQSRQNQPQKRVRKNDRPRPCTFHKIAHHPEAPPFGGHIASAPSGWRVTVQAALCTLGPGVHHTTPHPEVHPPNLDNHLALQQQPCQRRMCLSKGGPTPDAQCAGNSLHTRPLGHHSSLDTTSSSSPPPSRPRTWKHTGTDRFETELLPECGPAWAVTRALVTPQAKATSYTKASQARAGSEKVTKSNQNEPRRARAPDSHLAGVEGAATTRKQ